MLRCFLIKFIITKTILVLFSIFFVTTSLNLYSSDNVIADIKREYKIIRSNLKEYDISFFDNSSWENPNGYDLKIFSENNEIKLVINNWWINDYTEENIDRSIRITEEYYFKNSSLFFIFKKEEHWVSNNKDRYEDKKFKKIEDRFYFDQNRMIRWLHNRDSIGRNRDFILNKEYMSLKSNDILNLIKSDTLPTIDDELKTTWREFKKAVLELDKKYIDNILACNCDFDDKTFSEGDYYLQNYTDDLKKSSILNFSGRIYKGGDLLDNGNDHVYKLKEGQPYFVLYLEENMNERYLVGIYFSKIKDSYRIVALDYIFFCSY